MCKSGSSNAGILGEIQVLKSWIVIMLSDHTRLLDELYLCQKIVVRAEKSLVVATLNVKPGIVNI